MHRRQALQDIQAAQAPPANKDRLGPLQTLDLQDLQVLRGLLAPQAQRELRGLQVSQDLQVLQDLPVLQDLQVSQDLQVLQDLPVL